MRPSQGGLHRWLIRSWNQISYLVLMNINYFNPCSQVSQVLGISFYSQECSWYAYEDWKLLIKDHVYRMVKVKYSNIWPNQTIVSNQSLYFCVNQWLYMYVVKTTSAGHSDHQLLPFYIWLLGNIESIVSSNSLITLRGTSGAFIEQYNVREEIDQGDKELEINRVLRINESRTDQPCLIEIFDHLK